MKLPLVILRCWDGSAQKMLSHFSAVGMFTNNAATTTAEVSYRGCTCCKTGSTYAHYLPRTWHGYQGRMAVLNNMGSNRDKCKSFISGNFSIANDLLGLDAVVIDLPDVGARFYTYLWSATHLMEACAVMDIPVFFLTDQISFVAILDESKEALGWMNNAVVHLWDGGTYP